MTTQLDLLSAKRVLSYLEVDERMEMSLCLLCDQPCTLEHQSAHKKFRIVVLDNEDEEPEQKEHEDQALNLSIATETTTTVPTKTTVPNDPFSFEQAPTSVTPKTAIPCDLASCSYDLVSILGDDLRKDMHSSNPKLESQNEELEEEPPVAAADAAEEDPAPEIVVEQMERVSPTTQVLASSEISLPFEILSCATFSPYRLNTESLSGSRPYFNFIFIMSDLTSLDEDSPSTQKGQNGVTWVANQGVAVAPIAFLMTAIPPPEPPDRGADPAPFLELSLSVTTPKELASVQYPNFYSFTALLPDFQMFEQMPKCHVTVWSGIIIGSKDNEQENVGFKLFKEMHRMEVKPCNYTSSSMLSLGSLKPYLDPISLERLPRVDDIRIGEISHKVCQFFRNEDYFQEAYAAAMTYIPQYSWYVDVYMHSVWKLLADWVFECFTFVSWTWFTLEYSKYQWLIPWLTNDGWGSNSKNWFGLCCDIENWIKFLVVGIPMSFDDSATSGLIDTLLVDIEIYGSFAFEHCNGRNIKLVVYEELDKRLESWNLLHEELDNMMEGWNLFSPHILPMSELPALAMTISAARIASIEPWLLINGITHNFPDLDLVKLWDCKLEDINSMTVLVNGVNKLQAPLICRNFSGQLQQTKLSANVRGQREDQLYFLYMDKTELFFEIPPWCLTSMEVQDLKLLIAVEHFIMGLHAIFDDSTHLHIPNVGCDHRLPLMGLFNPFPLFQQWVIHDSNNPYAFPLVLVSKNDDSWGPCVDLQIMIKHAHLFSLAYPSTALGLAQVCLHYTLDKIFIAKDFAYVNLQFCKQHSLLLLQLVKWVVVMHRKMIERGSVQAAVFVNVCLLPRLLLLVLQWAPGVIVFHRKMIDWGRVRAPPILLKWKTLPRKHGTWKYSSLRTRMFEGAGIVTGK